MQKFVSTLAAAAIALTATVSSQTVATAAPIASPAIQVDSGRDGIAKVGDSRWWLKDGKHRRSKYRSHRRWDGDRHHKRYYSRYRHRHYGHRHRDNDFDAAIGLGIVGLAAGAILGSQVYGNNSSSWAAACDRKYNSFNYRTGTYTGYDGRQHRCVLP